MPIDYLIAKAGNKTIEAVKLELTRRPADSVTPIYRIIKENQYI